MEAWKWTWVVALFLLLIAGRFVWLIQTDQIQFESDPVALLTAPGEHDLSSEIQRRASGTANRRILAILQSANIEEVNLATDRLSEWIELGIENNKLFGKLVNGAGLESMFHRIDAMIPYKDRLIADSSRDRIQSSAMEQLNWRAIQVSDFLPSNLTSQVLDPLGTLDDFLAERLPRLRGVWWDGLYLRVDNEMPTTMLSI